MESPKLLIADSTEEFRQALTQSLAQAGTVQACGDGAQALELLQSFRPDILILDLMLPQIDGISLLHRAKEAGLCPVVLALSSFLSPYVASALGKLDVALVLTKPCNLDAVAAHVSDLAAELMPPVITQADKWDATANLLLRLGFSTKLDGFHYLQAALPIYTEDPRQPLTKELYPAVGKLYNKNGNQVERSIRNAIEIAWKRRDEAGWQAFFGVPGGMEVPKPSNGAFISRMTAVLTQQLRASKGA